MKDRHIPGWVVFEGEAGEARRGIANIIMRDDTATECRFDHRHDACGIVRLEEDIWGKSRLSQTALSVEFLSIRTKGSYWSSFKSRIESGLPGAEARTASG